MGAFLLRTAMTSKQQTLVTFSRQAILPLMEQANRNLKAYRKHTINLCRSEIVTTIVKVKAPWYYTSRRLAREVDRLVGREIIDTQITKWLAGEHLDYSLFDSRTPKTWVSKFDYQFQIDIFRAFRKVWEHRNPRDRQLFQQWRTLCADLSCAEGKHALQVHIPGDVLHNLTRWAHHTDPTVDFCR